MACKKNHSDIQDIMKVMPDDQGGDGRHKCAACAYEKGYQDGLHRKQLIDIEGVLDSLAESQAKAQRHKSPHAAYAKGYADGVIASYNN